MLSRRSAAFGLDIVLARLRRVEKIDKDGRQLLGRLLHHVMTGIGDVACWRSLKVIANNNARPIRKGRLGKPVEFGYKAQVLDNEDGVVVDHEVLMGNPPDAPMLAPAIVRVARRANRIPQAVTADRGYGERAVGEALDALGVTQVVLPSKGRPSAKRRAIENQEDFQELVRWRTGCQGRISCLKRDIGWHRTRMDGLEGARTWCGDGVFNHNLVKIAALVASS